MWNRRNGAVLTLVWNTCAGCRSYSTGAVVRLSSVRYGDPEKDRKRPPLVICHGLFGQKQNWHSVSKEVQKRLGCTIYSLDLRNHGESPWADSMTYDEMSADVVDFLESIKTETDFTHFRLLGHSMGGRVVMRLSINPAWQHLIDRLIVEDISPKTYAKDFDSHEKYRRYIHAMAAMDMRKSRRELLQEFETIVPDLTTRQFLLTNLGPSDVSGVSRWRCNLEAIDEHLEDILRFSMPPGAFNGPTLFVYGESSPYLTNQNRDDVKSIFPKAVFEGIPNAGHWVHAEQPAAFMDCICKFLM
ncbi:hypothetical protein Q1695_010408 [Nippostrongylus brasiliensis]|nr:hypothetical protein Q1695_010408 [Nippostrongylus brasiliensis]